MSENKPLRWGLLSTARINRAVIPPIRSSQNSQLVAVASRSEEKASEYAAIWNIPRFYSSYEQLMDAPEIDVIYISLPNGLHAEWSLKAMRMGKHVLCEKPLATRSGDVDALLTASRDTGKVIAEAFMYRHHPQTKLVKQMIERGDIGKLQFIRGSFSFTLNRPSNPRLDPTLGGGSLWDVGCYPISYARYLVGQAPVEVYGHQVVSTSGVDLSFAGQLLFRGDITAQFNCSYVSPHKTELEITGEKGRMIIPEPFKPGIRTKIILAYENHEQIIKVNGPELYQGEIEDLEQAIIFGKPQCISLEESKDNISTIENLYQSAKLSKSILIMKN